MSYGKRPACDDRAILDRLSRGERPQAIATCLGFSYSTIRRRLSRYVKASGCTTPEQAVARHVADKIRAELPLALQGHVERALSPHFRPKKP